MICYSSQQRMSESHANKRFKSSNTNKQSNSNNNRNSSPLIPLKFDRFTGLNILSYLSPYELIQLIKSSKQAESDSNNYYYKDDLLWFRHFQADFNPNQLKNERKEEINYFSSWFKQFNSFAIQ